MELIILRTPHVALARSGSPPATEAWAPVSPYSVILRISQPGIAFPGFLSPHCPDGCSTGSRKPGGPNTCVWVYFSVDLILSLPQPDSFMGMSVCAPSPGWISVCWRWELRRGSRLRVCSLGRLRTLGSGITSTFLRAQGLFKLNCVLPGCIQRKKQPWK